MNEKVVSRDARTTELRQGGNRSPVPYLPLRAGGNGNRSGPVVLVAVGSAPARRGRGRSRARPANTGGWGQTRERTADATPRQFLAHRWYFYPFREGGTE